MLQLISISNDTANKKILKRGINADVKTLLANADEVIMNGEWREGTRPGAIDVFAEFDNRLWKIPIAKSVDGYLYIRTAYPHSRSRRTNKVLKKAQDGR